MARIRTIKPEFPHSESMGRVSRDARLTFIMLWTIADDSGRLRGNSRMLASLLFPYDEDAPKKICGWLDELERESCLLRYQADGQSYIEICNWLNHQKIDKPSSSKLPPFDDSSRTFENPREDSRTLPVGSKEGNGREGNGPDMSGKPDLATPSRELLDFLNEKAGRAYKPVPANLDLIKARLREGYTPAEIRQVIAKKCREWSGDEKMAMFLRPETLFGKTKMAQYTGELVVPKEAHA